jgi:hypothetical protein
VLVERDCFDRFNRREIIMSSSPLRIRMIEDMSLAGLAPSTRALYISAVRKLAAH